MTPNLPGPERVRELREWLEEVRFNDQAEMLGDISADLLAILDALPGLQAEVERLTNLQQVTDGLREQHLEWALKAEAELTAARPLIEAVMGAAVMNGPILASDTGHDTGEFKPFLASGKVAILREALLLRQCKEKGK